jgi:hypothetical protein
MRYPQLVIHEPDGALARALREFAEQKRWVVRQPKRVDSCIRLLASGQPCVLVLRAGRDMMREMTLLERSCWLCPETPVVVVSEPENIPLNGLAWHLGVSCIVAPKQTPELLPAVVAGLMERSCANPRSARAPLATLEREDLPSTDETDD